jgi:diguanylate cyclase (GGDEF)-like protein
MAAIEGVDADGLFAAVVDRINLGVLAVDRRMRVVLWNGFMEAHSGRPAAEVLGGDLFALFAELPERWLRKKIESVFILGSFAFTAADQRPYLFRFRPNRPVTGGIDFMQQDCTFFPIKSGSGEVDYVGISVADVTDASLYQSMLKSALRSMEEMSVRDALTGLYNRRHLEFSLEAEFSRVRRYGGDLSVLLLDIDHFKEVNDRFGHQAGDEVLKVVAKRVQELLRKADMAARYGGEEFTVILPNTALAGACVLAERLRQAVAASPIRVKEQEVGLSISVGVSELRPETASADALLNSADQALYEAKAAGRDRVVAAFSH